MAEVLIPVVIDIEGAFDDAAARVNTAVKPLKAAIDKATLDMKINVGYEGLEKEYMKLSDILKKIKDDTTFLNTHFTMEKLQNAIRNTKLAYDELSASIIHNNGIATPDQRVKLSQMQEVIILLEQERDIRTRSSKLIDEEARRHIAARDAIDRGNAALLQEANTIERLNQKISALEGKLKNITPGTKEWGDTAREIQKATEKLAAFNDKIATLKTAPGSINRVSAEMQALNRKWEAMSKAAKFDKDGNLSKSAQIIIDKYKQLSSEAKKFGQSLSEAAKVAEGKTRSLNVELSRTDSRLKSLITRSAYFFSLHSILRFLRNIRTVTAEFELQKVALGSIIQDTERAADLFREIKSAALKSPFEIKDLVTYTKQLAAYRIETDKLFDVTMKLADVSAGLGVDMNRLILAYGQVRAAAVLRGQELRQFTEAGIPLVDMLAEKFRQLGREGTTTADVFELISKRAVSFKMIEEIFDDMTSAGGVFYKMQEKQAETLKGQWMKLRDSISIMYDEMGNTGTVHDAMTELIKTANNLTRSWRDVATFIKSATAVIVTYNMVAKASVAVTAAMTKEEATLLAIKAKQTLAMPKFIAVLVGETTAKKLNLWATKRLEVAQYRLATATTVLGRAFWKMYAALMSNPYALAAAAVVGLVAAIVALLKKTNDAKISVDALQQSIDRFKDSSKKAADVGDLINAYETLSAKANKTEEEQKKLNRITKELSKTFPSAVSGINEETGALEINIEKVKELTAAERELELARIRRDEKRAKKSIKDLEEERDSIINKYKQGGYYSSSGGQDTPSVFVPWSEDDLAKFGERLREINTELEPLKKSVEEIRQINFIGPLPKEGEDLTKTLTGWKKVVWDIQEAKVSAGANPIWTKDDIEKMEDVYDLYKQVKKGIQETEVEVASLKALQDSLVDEDAIKSNEAALNLAEKRLEIWKATQDAFGFIFKKEGSTYTQDPFIKMIENRMKFMKDFQNGYEDLSKYLASDTALDKELGYMRERGLSLGISESEQKMAARDLSKWYQDTIDSTFEYLKKEKGVSGEMSDFLSRQITGNTNRDRMLRDFQKMMQSLFDAKTDFDVSQKKKEIEDALKRLSNEIKQSEEAKNFYNDILGLSGDQTFAANMTMEIYGTVGDDFKKQIQKELSGTFAALTPDEADKVSDVLKKSIEDGDIKTLMAHINKLPEKMAEAVKKAANATEKYNADIAKNYVKLLNEYDDIEHQKVDIANKAAEKRKTIEKGLELEIASIYANKSYTNEVADAKVKEAGDRAKRAYQAIDNEEKLELFKLADNYRMFFDSVGILSRKSAQTVAKNVKKMLTDQFVKGEISLSRFKREFNEVNNQLEKYYKSQDLFKDILSGGGFDAITNALKQYGDNLLSAASRVSAGEDGMITIDDDTKAFLRRIDLILNKGGFVKALKNTFSKDNRSSLEVDAGEKARKAYLDAMITEGNQQVAKAKATQAAAESLAESGSQFSEAAGEFAGGAAEFLAIFYTVADWFDFIEKMQAMSESTDTTGMNTPDWMYALFGLNEGLVGAMNDLQSGKFFSAFYKLIMGFGDLVKPTRYINAQIKEQAELIEDLKHEYDRLGVAMSKSFGSDYIANYNQQLESLKAQAEAYRKQAKLEQEKKTPDPNATKGYLDAARDVDEAIEDMEGKLAEFFTDTDLASAAKDFAQAWIDAYQEFGSTTDAMKEKFNDMIEEMVINSLAARLVQGILKPIFDQIDEAAQDGALTAQEIASISAMVPDAMSQIDAGMTGMVNELTAAGVNLRQQAGSFTGISRDIANASEESINGLAAGINTQNFYISHIDQNVALILSALTGGTTTAQASVTGQVADPYKDEMLKYAAHMPTIDQNLADLLAEVKKVIKPNGVAAQHYVATNL